MSLTDLSDVGGVFVDGSWRSPTLARTTWYGVRRGEYLLRTVDFPVSWDPRVLPPVDTARSDDFEMFAQVLPAPKAPEILERWRLGMTPLTLPSRPRPWTILGYDVCDEAGLSGLMNCGYDGRLRAAYELAWAPLLNSLHLFSDESHANDFRLDVDARVPEHAPFLVYRLYGGKPRG